MRKKQLLQNPWVVAVIGVGLSAVAGCKGARPSSMIVEAEPETVMASVVEDHEEMSTETNNNESSNEPILVTTSTGQTMLVVPEITPSARGCNKANLRFISTVDMLYWGFAETGLIYASLGDSATPQSYTNQEIGQNWGFGFKAGFGIDLPYNGWDVYTNMTYWRNNTTASIDAGTAVLVPTFLAPAQGVDTAKTELTATGASGYWNLKFGQIDLELGRLYSISKKLKLRPMIGLEYARIRQNIDATYTGVAGSAPAYTNFNSQNNFTGIGPRAGLQTRWLLGANFGITANATGALLWGKTNSSSRSAKTGVQVILNDSRMGIKPQAQAALGLDWARCFKGKYFFRLAASYEAQLLWDQLNTPTRNTSNNSGNLSSQGLTVNARFEY